MNTTHFEALDETEAGQIPNIPPQPRNSNATTVSNDLLPSAPLPEGAKALRELLTRLDNTAIVTTRDQTALAARRLQISVSLRAIENGPTAPTTDANSQAALAVGLLSRSGATAERIASLQASRAKVAQAIADTAGGPLVSQAEDYLAEKELISLTPVTRLYLEGEINHRLQLTRLSLADCELHALCFEREMGPADAVAEVRAKLGRETDPTKARVLADEITKYSAPGAIAIADMYRSAHFTKWLEAKAELVSLCECCLDFLRGYESRAREIEAGWFAGFRLPPQVTPISTRYTKAIRELDQHISQLKAYVANGFVPSCRSNPVLQWFGMNDIFPEAGEVCLPSDSNQ